MRPTKAEKTLAFFLIKAVGPFRPQWATRLQLHFYERWGMNLRGRPNYISSRTAIDGTDYSLITLGEGVTISSYVRILTHDWAAHTIAKAVDVYTEKPLGRVSGIEIGAHSFVGTGSIIMPGTKIGRGCLVGAGTVVRGDIPDFSIVIGSPGTIIGDTRKYLQKNFDIDLLERSSV